MTTGNLTEHFQEFTQGVVLLYQRTSVLSYVNEARKQLFAFGNRKIENIPPMLHALEQHVKMSFIKQDTSGDSH